MQRIAFIGVMGTGKTTLGQNIAKALNVPFHPEPFEKSSFIPKCYQDSVRWGFTTQIEMLKLMIEHSNNVGVMDTIPAVTAKVFAPSYIGGLELELFNSFYNLLKPQITQPDLTVFLDAPINVIVSRIAKRGRGMERGINPAFIENLTLRMQALFDELPQPKIRIDYTEFLPVSQVLNLIGT